MRKMGLTAKKNKEKLIIAMENNLGIVTASCKEVGLSRETYYKYYKEDKQFKAEIDALDEFQMDFVEHQLFKAIKNGDNKSILFYMKYKGKNRGYTSSQDINLTAKIEQPLFLPIDNTDDKED